MNDKVFFSGITGKEILFSDVFSPEWYDEIKELSSSPFFFDFWPHNEGLRKIAMVLKTRELEDFEMCFGQIYKYNQSGDEDSVLKWIDNLMDKDEYDKMPNEDWLLTRLSFQVDHPIYDTIEVVYGKKKFDPFNLIIKKKDGSTQEVTLPNLYPYYYVEEQIFHSINSDLGFIIDEIDIALDL